MILLSLASYLCICTLNFNRYLFLKFIFQYSVLISQLCERAKNTVTDLDPSDELIYFRLMGKKEEILVTPEEDFIMITVQNNIARRNPDPEVEIPKEE